MRILRFLFALLRPYTAYGHFGVCCVCMWEIDSESVRQVVQGYYKFIYEENERKTSSLTTKFVYYEHFNGFVVTIQF